jgi:hypothetical protein
VPRTFLLVHTQHNDNLVTPNADELLDTTDTTSREFGEQDHAIDVVVFEELHVRSHVGDLYGVSEVLAQGPLLPTYPPYLLDVYHYEGVNLWILLLVKAAV